MSNAWSHSFWDCFSPVKQCLLACCCPCVLYGRTAQRLDNPGRKTGSCVNGDCCLFSVASCCGLQWFLMTLKRGDIRKEFKINGSLGGDCISSCCCPCCVLVQQEKEFGTQDSRNSDQGYQNQSGMRYEPSQTVDERKGGR